MLTKLAVKFVNLILKAFPLEVVYMAIGNPAFASLYV